MKTSSVDELRSILVKSGKFTQEQADSIKGKTKLTKEVMALEKNEDIEINNLFDNAEIEENIPKDNVEVEEKTNPIPEKFSQGWQKFVLSQFRAEELDEGYPKLPGLRRVAQQLIGRIISSLPTQITTIVDERNTTGRSNCIYEIVFEDAFGEKIKFGSAASSWAGNTDDEFSVFTEAIAESRAEARTLRKALNLNIVSKDELTSKNIKEVIQSLNTKEKERDGSWSEDGEISTSQKFMIPKTCDRLGIDLNKLLSKEMLATDINNLTKKEATTLIELLNKYQSSGKESIEIPVEIKKVS